MDGKRLKEFITKRSTIWTLSFCMTGIIVLGGIASLERAQRGNVQQETETVPGREAAAGSDGQTMEEVPGSLTDEFGSGQLQADGSAGSREADDLAAVNADGTADEDSKTDAAAEGAPGENGEENTGGADGAAAVNADGAAKTQETADGSAAEADTEDADSAALDDADTEEAASANIISEQTLIDHGISYEAEDASLLWPSAGTILIDYSMDGSVYFPTLNQYKYNPALVIGSDTGNQVLAAAKGIVESTYIDEETGTTLVLNLGNGYKLTYGGLKELQAKEGDVLEEGAVIGYVSEPTKYYSKEGSNVYFAMTKDGEPVDPILYLE